MSARTGRKAMVVVAGLALAVLASVALRGACPRPSTPGGTPPPATSSTPERSVPAPVPVPVPGAPTRTAVAAATQKEAPRARSEPAGRPSPRTEPEEEWLGVRGVVLDARTRLPLAGAQVRGIEEQAHLLARTGPDGAFAVEALGTTCPALSIQHPRHDRATLGARPAAGPSAEPVEVLLEPLEGVGFLDLACREESGAPLAYPLAVSGERLGTLEVALGDGGRQTLEVAPGTYRVRGIEAYLLLFAGSEDDLPRCWRAGQGGVLVRPGEHASAEVVLVRSAEVHGTVPGAPEGATLWYDWTRDPATRALGDRLEGMEGLPLAVEIDFEAGGRFRRFFPPGKGTLWVQTRDGASPRRAFALGPGEVADADFTVEMSVVVTGIVLRASDRAPVARASVWTSDLQEAATDARGRFDLRGSAVPAWVRASAPGFVRRTLQLKGRIAPAEVSLELEPAGTLAVVATAASGGPASDVGVTVRRRGEGERYEEQGQTEAQGAAEFAQLPPGTYDVEVDGAVATAAAEVRVGEAAMVGVRIAERTAAPPAK